jgi:hypothetical protein
MEQFFKTVKELSLRPGMVTHTYNPSTLEAEAGRT